MATPFRTDIAGLATQVTETWHKCGLLAFPSIIRLINILMLLRPAFFAFSLGVAASAIAHAAEPPTPLSAPASSARDALVTAIRDRRVVTFVYQGRERTVEPHACGIASATSEAVLHGYQIEGESASGTPPGWRTFAVDKITALAVTGKSFPGPRKDYAAGRPRLDPLWAEVAATATP